MIQKLSYWSRKKQISISASLEVVLRNGDKRKNGKTIGKRKEGEAMLKSWKLGMAEEAGRIGLLVGALVVAGAWTSGAVQETKGPGDGGKRHEGYKPIPGFDPRSVDTGV